MARGRSPKESGAISPHRDFQLEAKRADHLQHGTKFKIPLQRKRLAEALAAKARGLRDLRHALGACGIAQCSRNQSRVAVVKHGFEIIGDVLVGLELIRRIPRYRLGSDFCPRGLLKLSLNVCAVSMLPSLGDHCFKGLSSVYCSQ